MSVTAMFAYNSISMGGADLADAIGIKRIKHVGSTFKGASSKTLINWGSSSERLKLISASAEILKCQIINHPSKVDVACDKLKSFQVFKAAGVPVPNFTSSRTEAVTWLEAGKDVFARTQLRAHSGRGIVHMMADHQDTWDVNAELYVEYIPKKHEYRVHVFRGQVLDTQRKGLREELKGTEGVNFKIRNLQNGFVFVRNDGHVVPQVVKDAGVKAVTALGLDFGAVDIVYNEKAGAAYVLEVNCAPGLQGTTLENYAKAMSSL